LDATGACPTLDLRDRGLTLDERASPPGSGLIFENLREHAAAHWKVQNFEETIWGSSGTVSGGDVVMRSSREVPPRPRPRSLRAWTTMLVYIQGRIIGGDERGECRSFSSGEGVE
jgi:hypothetical protein